MGVMVVKRSRYEAATLGGRLLFACVCLAIALGAVACRRADDSPRTAQPAVSRAAGRPATAPADAAARLSVNSARGAYRIEFATRPWPIPLNEPFEVDVRVLDASSGAAADGIVLSVDAAMPEHGHGMNTQPVVSGPREGEYTARGMLFHMPGRWELYFDIQRGGTTERATYVVELE